MTVWLVALCPVAVSGCELDTPRPARWHRAEFLDLTLVTVWAKSFFTCVYSRMLAAPQPLSATSCQSQIPLPVVTVRASPDVARYPPRA